MTSTIRISIYVARRFERQWRKQSVDGGYEQERNISSAGAPGEGPAYGHTMMQQPGVGRKKSGRVHVQGEQAGETRRGG